MVKFTHTFHTHFFFHTFLQNELLQSQWIQKIKLRTEKQISDSSKIDTNMIRLAAPIQLVCFNQLNMINNSSTFIFKVLRVSVFIYTEVFKRVKLKGRKGSTMNRTTEWEDVIHEKNNKHEKYYKWTKYLVMNKDIKH